MVFVLEPDSRWQDYLHGQYNIVQTVLVFEIIVSKRVHPFPNTVSYLPWLFCYILQVGSLNFDPAYQNEERPVTFHEDTAGIFRYHTYDDIFTRPTNVYSSVS